MQLVTAHVHKETPSELTGDLWPIKTKVKGIKTRKKTDDSRYVLDTRRICNFRSVKEIMIENDWHDLIRRNRGRCPSLINPFSADEFYRN
jgi:hypothetical protein